MHQTWTTTIDAEGAAPGRRQSTRATVLRAADRLFCLQGIEATSIDQVAREAHVAVGTLYFHFGNKEGLSLAVAELSLTALEQRLQTLRRVASPIRRVLLAGELHVEFAIQFPAVFRFETARMMEPGPIGVEHEERESLRVRRRQALIMVEHDLKLAIEYGEIRPEPVSRIMALLLSTWHGVAFEHARQDPLAISQDAARASIGFAHGLLLESLAPPTQAKRGRLSR